MASKNSAAEPGVFVRDDIPRRHRMQFAALFGLLATLFSLHPTSLGVTFLVLMLGILLYRSDLRLDANRRTYRRTFGVTPMVRVREGSIDEIAGLELEITAAEGSQMSAKSFTLRLIFKSGAGAIVVHSTPDFAEISTMAAQLARGFGWMVIEGPVLRKQRALFGEVPYELPSGKP